MAALDDRSTWSDKPQDRHHHLLHDWLPLLVIAAVCFVVVSFNVHV